MNSSAVLTVAVLLAFAAGADAPQSTTREPGRYYIDAAQEDARLAAELERNAPPPITVVEKPESLRAQSPQAVLLPTANSPSQVSADDPAIVAEDSARTFFDQVATILSDATMTDAEKLEALRVYLSSSEVEAMADSIPRILLESSSD